MTTLKLTLDEANELLDAAVAEKGKDYIYIDADGIKAGPNAICSYVHFYATGESGPGCLVGNVLLRKGVPVESLLGGDRYEDRNVDSVKALLPALANDGVLDVEEGVEELFTAVQGKQDAGTPWGEAVRQAREELARGEL